jgi:sulfur-carrier protein
MPQKEIMEIKVRLFATLRENRGKELQLSLSEDITPADIIDKLEIAKADVAILLVNGRDGSLDQQLNDGDVVSIFPPVGGG